jgi:hypothetical protein
MRSISLIGTGCQVIAREPRSVKTYREKVQINRIETETKPGNHVNDRITIPSHLVDKILFIFVYLLSLLSSPLLSPPHLVLSHLTSPHLTSPHLTSPHLTSPHLTSPHLTSHLSPLTSLHLTSHLSSSPLLSSPLLSASHFTLTGLTIPKKAIDTGEGNNPHPALTLPLNFPSGEVGMIRNTVSNNCANSRCFP